MKRIEVWDLPLRLFHWALFVLVVISIATGLLGGDKMDLHMLSGYGILTLVLFRLAWGFAGNRYARFAQFLRAPGAGVRYLSDLLSGKPQYHVGHNPAAAWMVVGMLLVLLIQAGTGLFATDDIFVEGPLRYHVSDAASSTLTRLHKLNYVLLASLIVLHLLAVTYYQLVKRVNLTWPMIVGSKEVNDDVEAAPVRTWLAAPILLVVLVVVYGVVNWI